jgi:hypothetical protein
MLNPIPNQRMIECPCSTSVAKHITALLPEITTAVYFNLPFHFHVLQSHTSTNKKINK